MNSTSSREGNNGSGSNSRPKQQVIYFDDVYDSCLIVLAVFIVAINILVPALFVRNRALRTKTNMLLVSLAVADMVMGFIGIPMCISCNALAAFPEYGGLCFTAAVVYRFIAVSTIFHIFAITIERYISVSYPFNYVTWVKMSRLRVVIASIWVGSLLMALIQLSWNNISRNYATNRIDPVEFKAGLIYNLISVFACFMIPLAVMFFIYWRMFKIIRKQIKRIKQQNVTAYQENCKPLSSERRAITIFALMLGIFTTCWLTWYISLLANFFPDVFNLHGVSDNLYNIFDFLRFSTSFINPLLYTFLKTDFRKALFRLVSSKCAKIVKGKNNASETTIGFSTTAVRYKCSKEDPEETKKLTSI